MPEVKENHFLIDVLKKLDFFSTDIAIEDSFPEIVFIQNPSENLHPKHYIALEFAEILEADAVYFKYYDDNRFCVPQVYFYDFSNKNVDSERLAQIHRNVYSSSQVPLICVIDKKNIYRFDVRKPVKLDNNNKITNDNCLIEKSNLFEELDFLSKYFNAKKLNSGDYWESDEASTHFKNNKSVYEELVNALSLIRKDFHTVFQTFSIFENAKLANDFADEVLFKCILIKYLEENGLEFAQQFYKDNKIPQNSLNKILESGQLIQLLECLEFHFNGNVFSIQEDKKNILRELDLSTLALCLDGKYGSNSSGYLWEMYSFKHIPIELISNFYEEFIPKDKENSGTVYTPSHLVNLLIDECLPLSDQQAHLNSNVRLADVSCGSGIFITTAFKRLVQRLRIEKWIECGKPQELPKPTLQEVKSILSNNIFGIDKNDTATKLAKFSLQLALCQLVPKEELWTWNEDRVFKDLHNINIFSTDFFDFLVAEKSFHNSLDLIIGNPPFQGIGEKKYKEYKENLKKINFTFKVEIPRKQLALMFLETSPILLNENGLICFIQKSTSLLYNKDDISVKYKNHFFSTNNVTQIIDFTLLKDCLFENATVETCAIFYKNEYKENYSTLHVVSKLLRNTKQGLSFEFDYYNLYEVSKETILEDNTIWRCNLLGGNRLNQLIKKLNKKTKFQTNLEDYIYNYLKIEKERFGEGYKRKSKSTKTPLKAEYLNGKYGVEATNITYNKIELTKIKEDAEFDRIRCEKLYSNPVILIKEEVDGYKIPIFFRNDYTPFDSRIIGISSSDFQTKELQNLFQILKKNEKILALHSISTSSQFYFRGKTAIQKRDIANWTIPLEGDELKLSDSEKIIMNDVLDYIYPSWNLGENAIINKNETSKKELIEFGEVFNESFNAIYKKEEKEQKLATIYEGSSFFALEFEYSTAKISKPKHIYKTEADKAIESLIRTHYGKNTVLNKVLRIYSPNKITLIKPTKLRFWLKSIALQDSDEVFDDIIENGLK
jgi:methylase of polypeptide subunit release factors